MIIDALIDTNPYFKFAENLFDPEDYMNYTDSIVKYIETTPKKEFKGAQKILKRLHCRDLYQCVGEKLMDHTEISQFEHVTPQDIVNCQDSDGTCLTVEDIVVHRFSINFGCGLQNPVELISFYNKTEKLQGSSAVVPDQFSEYYVRLFVKDPSKAELASSTFKRFISKFKFN